MPSEENEADATTQHHEAKRTRGAENSRGAQVERSGRNGVAINRQAD